MNRGESLPNHSTEPEGIRTGPAPLTEGGWWLR
jgi:hypothetical protein